MTFGPADTKPLSRRAKMLMLLQSMISLIVVALGCSPCRWYFELSLFVIRHAGVQRAGPVQRLQRDDHG